MLRARLAPVLGLMVSCHASVQADAQMSSEANIDPPAENDEAEPAESSSELRSLEGSTTPLVLLGARRDLTLRSTADAIACRCVKVVVGAATLPQFAWQEAAPPILPDTQLVFAFQPEEGCSGGPEGSNGASYWGYRIDGNDVIVLLEAWVKGPPRTVGAVLPRPPLDGQIFVAPVKADLPYGLPLSGAGKRCALGNPGPKRSTPFTPAETGAF